MIYVYLDTSFLSQLSKVTSNTDQKVAGAAKWVALLNMLRQGANCASLTCPAAQFQTQEAKLAEGLQEEIASLQHQLCRGRYLKEWQEILVHQTAAELLRYLGRPQDIDSSWGPFTGTPPIVVEAFTTQKMKSEMAKFAQCMTVHSVPESSYAKQYNAEKASFLQNSFLQPIRQLLGLPTYGKSFDHRLLSMLIDEARVTGRELQKALQFFDSPSVDLVPFIHIFCSIFASLRFNEQNRNYTGSEKEDAVALACAIPCCQIVTTDANMKTNVVDRLHFDEKYEVSVFAPREEDLDALALLLSDRLSEE